MNIIQKISAIILLTIIMAIGASITAIAQDHLPIGSYAELRAYAAEESHMAATGMYSSSGVEYGYYSTSWQEPRSSETIVGSIRGAVVNLTVANIKDPVNMYMQVYNNDYDVMFHGEKSGFITNVGGIWKLPDDFGAIRMEMNEFIPIRIPHATYAYLRYTDRNGQTTGYEEVRVYNWKVYFQSARADTTNATLWIHRYDDQNFTNLPTLVYQTHSGGGLVPLTSVTTMVQPSINGMRYFHNTENVVMGVPSTNKVGVTPTVELELTWGVTESINILVYSDGAIPIGYKIRPRGGDEWYFFEKTGPLPWLTIRLAPGFYYIVPVWNESEFKEAPRPYSPPYGSGKG